MALWLYCESTTFKMTFEMIRCTFSLFHIFAFSFCRTYSDLVICICVCVCVSVSLGVCERQAQKLCHCTQKIEYNEQYVFTSYQLPLCVQQTRMHISVLLRALIYIAHITPIAHRTQHAAIAAQINSLEHIKLKQFFNLSYFTRTRAAVFIVFCV